jgi:hypothetical protein
LESLVKLKVLVSCRKILVFATGQKSIYTSTLHRPLILHHVFFTDCCCNTLMFSSTSSHQSLLSQVDTKELISLRPSVGLSESIMTPSILYVCVPPPSSNISCTQNLHELLSEHPHAGDPDVKLEQCAPKMVPLWDVFSHQTDTPGIVNFELRLTIANPDVVGYIHPYVSPTSRTGAGTQVASSKYQKSGRR